MIKKIMYQLYFGLGRVIYGSRMCVERGAQFRLGGHIKSAKYIHIGKNFYVGKGWRFYVYEKTGMKDNFGKIVIGDNVTMQENIYISSMESVTIGNDVLFGGDIMINDNNHGMDPRKEGSYSKQNMTWKAIEIGDGAWIGEKVCILAGSKIGTRSIIGAGSVVTGEIPEYSIAVGIPARVIKVWNPENATWERVNY